MFKVIGSTALLCLSLSFAQIPEVELILDLSGSMWLELGTGETKIDAAKVAVTDLISSLPEDSLNMGLRVYGATVSGIDPAACTDSQQLLPITALDKALLSETVQASNPKGGTPIVYALNEAIKDFERVPNQSQKTIILVTDGQESCGQDLDAAVQRLSARGINLQVIGFGLTEKAARTFDGVGAFVNALNVAELSAVLEETVMDLSPIEPTIETTVTVEQPNDFAVDVDITVTPNDFAILDISGPEQLRYNAAATTYNLYWQGTPTYPITVTLEDIDCAFSGQEGACIFQSNPIATPLNPIPLSLTCTHNATASNDAASWTNEIKIIDSSGFETANYVLSIRCIP